MSASATLPFVFPTATAEVSDEQIRLLVAPMVKGYLDFMTARAPKVRVEKVVASAPLRAPLDQLIGLGGAKEIVSRKLSEAGESRYGDLMEQLALGIAKIAHGGLKAPASGVDLYFEAAEDETTQIYLISIKSTRRWGNSSQMEALARHFRDAQKKLSTSSCANKKKFFHVVGCCAGERTTSNLSHGLYYHIVGKDFWHLISGDPEMEKRIWKVLAETAASSEIVALAAKTRKAIVKAAKSQAL
jgi:hypothetical protein